MSTAAKGISNATPSICISTQTPDVPDPSITTTKTDKAWESFTAAYTDVLTQVQSFTASVSLSSDRVVIQTTISQLLDGQNKVMRLTTLLGEHCKPHSHAQIEDLNSWMILAKQKASCALEAQGFCLLRTNNPADYQKNLNDILVRLEKLVKKLAAESDSEALNPGVKDTFIALLDSLDDLTDGLFVEGLTLRNFIYPKARNVKAGAGTTIETLNIPEIVFRIQAAKAWIFDPSFLPLIKERIVNELISSIEENITTSSTVAEKELEFHVADFISSLADLADLLCDPLNPHLLNPDQSDSFLILLRFIEDHSGSLVIEEKSLFEFLVNPNKEKERRKTSSDPVDILDEDPLICQIMRNLDLIRTARSLMPEKAHLFRNERKESRTPCSWESEGSDTPEKKE